jgi:nucleoside-diphosphate-sugar epimerase
MKLLVLGGTRFVGRALVRDALARGWDVTALQNDSWDLVVDTWWWTPGGG